MGELCELYGDKNNEGDVMQTQRQYHMPDEVEGGIYVIGCPTHKPHETGKMHKAIHHCGKCEHHVSGHPMTITSGVIMCKHGSGSGVRPVPKRRMKERRETPPRVGGDDDVS